MSAYVVVSFTPLDYDLMQEYAALAAKTVAAYQGEYIAKGEAEVLSGDAAHPLKVIIAFPDAEAAKAWYQCDEYQALIDMRTRALNAVVQLLA